MQLSSVCVDLICEKSKQQRILFIMTFPAAMPPVVVIGSGLTAYSWRQSRLRRERLTAFLLAPYFLLAPSRWKATSKIAGFSVTETHFSRQSGSSA
jgi:hypothetical protein